MKPHCLAFLSILSLVSLIAAEPATSEIKTITATGEYRMGDNDTRTDAKRLALLDAKRLALEQAGTYLESVTEVKNLGVARDELNAYTAGIVEVIELSAKDVLEGATHIIRVEVTAKIDTTMVARQIDALRKNKTARAELLAARQEADRLRQENDALHKRLAAAKSITEIETLTQKRREVLTDQDVNSLLAQAQVALGGVDWNFVAGTSSATGRARARTLIDQALALAPSDPHAHTKMGTLLLEEGNPDGAIVEYRTALRLNPNLGEAHGGIGLALKAKGDLDGAIAEYRAALRLEPDDIVAHNNLGYALVVKGNLDEAIAELRTALRLKPDLVEAYNGIGVALRAKGDLDGAIAEYRAALSLRPPDYMPDYAIVHYNFGGALWAKGRRAEAAREFREYLRLTPDTPTNRRKIETARAMLRELE